MKLYEAIGNIDDDLITGAIDYRPRRVALWKFGMAAAAILCALAIGAVASHYINSPRPPVDTSNSSNSVPDNLDPNNYTPIEVETDNGDEIYINRIAPLDAAVKAATRGLPYEREYLYDEIPDIIDINIPDALGSFTREPYKEYILHRRSDSVSDIYEYEYLYRVPGAYVSLTVVKQEGLADYLRNDAVQNEDTVGLPAYSYKTMLQSTIGGKTGIYIGMHGVGKDNLPTSSTVYDHDEYEAVYFADKNTLVYFDGNTASQETFLSLLRDLVEATPPGNDLPYKSNQTGATNYDDVYQYSTYGGAVNPTTWGTPSDYEDMRSAFITDWEYPEWDLDSIYLVETVRALSDAECRQLGVYNTEQTHYKVRLIQDLISGETVNRYEIIVVSMGSPTIQSENDPVYGAGEMFTIAITKLQEGEVIRKALLGDLFRYDAFGDGDGSYTLYYRDHGGRSLLEQLNLPGSENIDETRITSTTQNPAVYTQKLPMESLQEFLRKDWEEWGISKHYERPFPGRSTTERPWYIPDDDNPLLWDTEETLYFPIDFTEEDKELQQFLKNTVKPAADLDHIWWSCKPTDSPYEDMLLVFTQMDKNEPFNSNHFYPIYDTYPQTVEELRHELEKYFAADYVEEHMATVGKAVLTPNEDGSYSVNVVEGGQFDSSGVLLKRPRFLEIDGRMYRDWGEGTYYFSGFWDSAKVLRKTDSELVYFFIGTHYRAYYAVGLLVYEDGWKYLYPEDYDYDADRIEHIIQSTWHFPD